MPVSNSDFIKYNIRRFFLGDDRVFEVSIKDLKKVSLEQILNSPVTLVPTPGEGKSIVVADE